MKSERKLPSPAAAIAALALFIAVGGIAFAAIPGPDGEIDACYKKSNGELRVVDTAEACLENEKKLTWNQQGERGPVGPQGEPGPPADGSDIGPAALQETQQLSSSGELRSFGPIGIRKPGPDRSISTRLLRVGPFTLRGHCARGPEPAPNDTARITAQTALDNSAAPIGDGTFGKWQSSKVINLLVSGAGSRVSSRSPGGFSTAPASGGGSGMFAAVAPDGSTIRVISLYTGGNYAGFDGKCIFGGDVLVG